MPRVPASLRALLSHLIDYAGLYPPASLPLEIVLERYRGFRSSPEAWILNRLVLPAAKLADARLEPFIRASSGGWRVTLLVDDDPGPLPPQIETLETKRPDLAATLPVYHEVPLPAVVHGFAKVRTGGLTADAMPSSGALAQFLSVAAARRIPFKATAGLHHPIRSIRPLTYAADSPRAPMHGFLNVFAAAALAWHGADTETISALLDEQDIAALRFDEDALDWRGRRISTGQIAAARRDFAHSFGSCSFEEPVSELRDAGLLP